ncbi:hypothetical protein CRP01_19505 [Flavilitoribacter nigricans DSM 23189 = NBRC 102662]|uniref:Chromosome partitioning protein ParA n=2 Tax=Flavilitoribacter TaxID=2762562 RepID=A0A2D0N863_FLAN2|nr:hypothetical protein CRP01_19505 [Flavilitoribacter nigricans DSM 23189 = NBRC 102662]
MQIKWYAGGITALTVLSFAGLFFFWNAKRNLETVNAEMNEAISGYTLRIDQLNTEIDSLMGAYASLSAENEDLLGSVENANQLLATRDAELSKIKRQSGKNLKAKQAELDQLMAFKNQLEETLARLETENRQLKDENIQLSRQLKDAQLENERLVNRMDDLETDNQYLQRNLDRMAPAGMQGVAFRVEVQRRNDKLTVKGKRARQVDVSFDLIGVPEEWHGQQTIYLSLVDNKGVPVKTENNRSQQFQLANGQTLSFDSQVAKDFNISTSQRLAFHISLDDKMPAGYYRANIYTRTGLVGSASFRLS